MIKWVKADMAFFETYSKRKMVCFNCKIGGLLVSLTKQEHGWRVFCLGSNEDIRLPDCRIGEIPENEAKKEAINHVFSILGKYYFEVKDIYLGNVSTPENS